METTRRERLCVEFCVRRNDARHSREWTLGKGSSPLCPFRTAQRPIEILKFRKYDTRHTSMPNWTSAAARPAPALSPPVRRGAARRRSAAGARRPGGPTTGTRYICIEGLSEVTRKVASIRFGRWSSSNDESTCGNVAFHNTLDRTHSSSPGTSLFSLSNTNGILTRKTVVGRWRRRGAAHSCRPLAAAAARGDANSTRRRSENLRFPNGHVSIRVVLESTKYLSRSTYLSRSQRVVSCPTSNEIRQHDLESVVASGESHDDRG